jgi:predicted  nucleic acid-binding Zn-ribbon protein
MQEVIEKLLILQDRDRRILRTKEQLSRIQPEQAMLQTGADQSKAAADAAKLRLKQIEADRKQLELDVDTKKGQIEKYALQQFQTKKNEEYRALAHEMDAARAAIVGIEDRQLELMQQAEDVQREVTAATRQADEIRKTTEGQLKELTAREKNLSDELAELESNRTQLTDGIDSNTLYRYDRLLRSKGDNAVVGIEHGVCGGCHMKFPIQLTVACQAAKEIVSCPNCGRILYYTRDMDMVVAE